MTCNDFLRWYFILWQILNKQKTSKKSGIWDLKWPLRWYFIYEQGRKRPYIYTKRGTFGERERKTERERDREITKKKGKKALPSHIIIIKKAWPSVSKILKSMLYRDLLCKSKFFLNLLYSCEELIEAVLKKKSLYQQPWTCRYPDHH